MARLYAIMAGAPAIAEHFGVAGDVPMPLPAELTEERIGIVVRERHGERRLQAMSWGFPRRMHGPDGRREGPYRIGLVADLTNPMWERIVVDPAYRCLIPLTHFANPDGLPRRRTRAWFSVKDAPLIAWAGFCARTDDLGYVYAGMTMEANEAVRPYNERMPALLDRDDYDRWLHGSIQDVIAFQFREPMDASRMTVLPTDDPWRSGVLPPIPELRLL